MYSSVARLRYTPIKATDGKIGFLEQVFFDDAQWAIRYLVVDTDQHLRGVVRGADLDRRVLISPISVAGIDLESDSLLVRLSKRQVEESPDVDTDKPVSRQKELEYNRYFGYAVYWGGSGLWGHEMMPGALLSAPVGTGEAPGAPPGDAHLRSSREVIGYRVQARDGRIGRIEDFIFDSEDWSIRYLEVDTRNWIGGKKVLVDPRWAGKVSWPERKVYVDLPISAIKSAPPFETLASLTGQYAAALRAHYGFPPSALGLPHENE